MTERTCDRDEHEHGHEDYENYEELYYLSKTDEPMPDGLYEVVVSDVGVLRVLDGDDVGYDVFAVDLGVLDPRYADRVFSYEAILNGRDNNHCVRRFLSALLHREVTNRDYIEFFDLFGRCARVRVETNNGERIMRIEPSKRRDKVPEYAREITTSPWCEIDFHLPIYHIPLYDLRWGR